MGSPFISYSDLECILKQMSTRRHNNPEKSSTTKINERAPSDFSLFSYCSFDATKNKLDCYRGIDCMERFCKDLKEHAPKIINNEKEEMIPLADEENKSYKKEKVCYICKKDLVLTIIKNIIKYYCLKYKVLSIRDYCYYTGNNRGTAGDICNLRYKTPNEIPVVFHNDSTYGYHFIIKELSK